MGKSGIVFDLEKLAFDAYGRVLIQDRKACSRLCLLFDKADAIACRSGCGAPLSCDTALILRDELHQSGPVMTINNADFASIIRKRKAVNAHEAVIVFTEYMRLESDLDRKA